jgi:flagellar biosynthesis/type III secretory pathway M-ring protein FliF/YscJ
MVVLKLLNERTELMNENDPNRQRPYWKQIHHTWLFWVFLFLMFAGIIYYIMSVDFAFAPHKQMKQSSENTKIR